MTITRVDVTHSPTKPRDEGRIVRVHIEPREEKPPVLYAAAPKAPEPKGRIMGAEDLVRMSFGVDMTAEQCKMITETAKGLGMPTPIYRRVR